MDESINLIRSKKTLPEKSEGGGFGNGNPTFKALCLTEMDQDFLSPEASWKNEDVSESATSKTRMITFCTVLLLGVLLLTGYFLWASGDAPKAPGVMTGQSMTEVPDIKVSHLFESSTTQELIELSKKAVKGFMSAESPEKSLGFIVGGSLRMPRMMEYYERSENSWPQGFQQIVTVVPNAIASIPYLLVLAKDKADNVHQFACVPCRDMMLVDWECSVGYGELSIEGFFEKKPSDPVTVRLIAVSAPSDDDGDEDEMFLPGGKLLDVGKSIGMKQVLDEGRALDDGGFLYLTDLYGKTIFRARTNESDQRLSNLLTMFTSEPKVLAQLTMTWNEELGCPNVDAVKHIWWFDFEAIKVSDSNFEF